jgi:hypothetical protein
MVDMKRRSIMRSRLVALVIGPVTLASVAIQCPALDYFGKIEENKLVLKLEPKVRTPFTDTLHIQFPCYIVLHKGYPILSQEAKVEEKKIDGQDTEKLMGNVGKLDIVQLIELPPMQDRLPDEEIEDFIKRMGPKVKRTQYLQFEFVNGGWNKDQYVEYIKIPYSIDPEDEKGMLKIEKEGIAEMRWRDPKSKAVTVVSYWSGMTPPFAVKVTVMESTLGFGNKIGVESGGKAATIRHKVDEKGKTVGQIEAEQRAKSMGEEQQKLLIAEIIKSKALTIALKAKETQAHVQLIQRLLPDQELENLFTPAETIGQRTILEFSNTLERDGMFQTNTRYGLSSCEMIINIAIFPEASLAAQLKAEQAGKFILRKANVKGKGVLLTKGTTHIGGSVYGKKLRVGFFARTQDGQEPSAMDETRLWDLLFSLAEKLE